MVISHNLAAMNANTQVGKIATKTRKSSEKLSSGYRINRAADDAAGLTISEKMRTQIRGLGKASTNAQDGISLIQTADGALSSLHALLQRGRELSVQAANDTNTDADRDAIQKEIDKINKEVDRIAKDTEFNTMKLFDSANAAELAPEVEPNILFLDSDYMKYDAQDFSGAIASAGAAGLSFTQSGLENFADALKTNYVPKLLSGITTALDDSAIPTISGASGNLTMGLKMYYEDNGTLAYCASNGTGYTLGVNLKYLTESGGTIAMPDSLATTIAHEMTHAVMFDANTNGMLATNGADRFPGWFTEGTAQTTGGGMSYVSALKARVGNTDSVKEWLGHLTDGGYASYAQGYVASMYLGQIAGGGSANAADATTIANGLDNILKDISDGYSLSEAISRQTSGKYASLTDFENHFANDAAGFAQALCAAAGATGAGSIISPSGLSGTQASLLSQGGTSTYFVLDTDTDWVDNRAAINAAGQNPYTGGGATTTPGTKRDGSDNADASRSWTDAGTYGGGFGGQEWNLQVGALSGQSVLLQNFKLSQRDLGIDVVDVRSFESAGNAITSFDGAIDRISDIRAYYGAIQNRLEHTIANVDNTSENTSAAESLVRDTDMATEMVEYSKNNILAQAAQAMLAQANQSTQGVLSLLQ